MAYRLGVDVGGTFTDLLLMDEDTGNTYEAKVHSTPEDSSIGVFEGIERICSFAGVAPSQINQIMHGTTVATNAILQSQGAKMGLVTTRGYKQVLQIERSFVPGGLASFIVWNMPDPLVDLELTVEAEERIGARGDVVAALNEAAIRKELSYLKDKDIESLTVSLVNSYANSAHERRIREIAGEIMPDIPVSLSSDILPEMYEFERTLTTAANGYVAPVISSYLGRLQDDLGNRGIDANLHILRSDGGLASVEMVQNAPVNVLMSGPAGGVAGALWIAEQAGYKNLITFDMGGTSTDVSLIENGIPLVRRETRVGDVTIRASSLDVRSVGAGGGSIAHVPELTRALRVGPQSAGADPGPAAYGRGGENPTVTDANVALGRLPTVLADQTQLDRSLAENAVQTVADALGLDLQRGAEGIIDIVNENMYGAIRLVSVEQGYDPRDFALMAFGGAGPLHANAIGRLTQSWPVIIPPSPGVLCAYGDATTKLRNEASQTLIRRFSETSRQEIGAILTELSDRAAQALDAEDVPRAEQTTQYQLDCRYRGQAFVLTVEVSMEELAQDGLALVGNRFADLHTQMFTFAPDVDPEVVNLRAIAVGPATIAKARTVASGGADPSAGRTGSTRMFVDGKEREASVYDRSRLLEGNRILGPAMVTEMDSTTLILPDHVGEVDSLGNILINPSK